MVIESMEMCAMETQHITNRSRASFIGLQFLVGDRLARKVINLHMEKVAMSAFVHPVMIKTIAEAPVESDDFMTSISTLVLIYVEKTLVASKWKKKSLGSR